MELLHRTSLPSLLIGLTLLLSGCDPQSQKQPKIETRTLAIPPMAIKHSDFPDLSTMRDEWFYSPNENEDPYQPVGPPHEHYIQAYPKLSFAEELAQAALARTMHRVHYDGRYLKIAYPLGDVPDNIGVCTDVVIRSYRALGVDLQQILHEDIRRNFSKYPSKKRWGLRKPDTNIDHRRVYNLQVFFERKGESIPITRNPRDFRPGDLVTWQVGPKLPHIGVVLNMLSNKDPSRHLIAHNIGAGPVIDDMLFEYKITGHYRYQPEPKHKTTSTKVSLAER